MGRHEGASRQLQVMYVGSSSELGTLRRSMEAHGMVTRTRLTPAVDAVVADTSVPPDHPTLRIAASLGIPVLAPSEAIEQLVDWAVPGESLHTSPPAGRSSWSFRPGHR